MDKRDTKKRPCGQCMREAQSEVRDGKMLVRWSGCCGTWKYGWYNGKVTFIRASMV